MPKPFTLPLNCPKCARPMSVVLQMPRHFQPDQEPIVCTIECPYGCGGQIHPKIHGRIISVSQGHEIS
jgi:hypothetical protein